MNMFGLSNDVSVNAVTVSGTQTVNGRKIFNNLNNSMSGYMNEVTIIAETLAITPQKLSFLHNLTSSVQDQIDAIDEANLPVEQALQALRPAPDANTVLFNNKVQVTDGGAIGAMVNQSNIRFDDTSAGPSKIATFGCIDALNSFNGIVCQDQTELNYPTLTLSTEALGSGEPGLTMNNSQGATISISTENIQIDATASGNHAEIVLTDNHGSNTLTSTTWSGSSSAADNANNATYASSVNIVDLSTGSTYPILYNSITTPGYNGLAMDVATGNHFYYSPGTNKIVVGGTTNGGLTINGTAGQVLVNGTGTAISCPNAAAISFPSATVSASLFAITGVPSTVNVAATFGQVGLVYLQTVTGSITGSASSTNFNLTSIFNTTYKNYKIILSNTAQNAYSAYPSYALTAYLGTSVPTTASLYGTEMTSASTLVVSPVFTSGATISATPLVFAVSNQINRKVIFDITNVGFANTANNITDLTCSSTYGNPGVTGGSNRTISATSISGATITGLTITQTSISTNTFAWSASIYGYNTI